MLVSEAQVQLWIKITNWESPDRSLKLYLGDQLLTSMIRLRKLLGNFNEQIPRAFLKTVNQNKTQVYIQKLDEYIHSYFNQLQIIIKEKSDLLVKMTRKEWKSYVHSRVSYFVKPPLS